MRVLSKTDKKITVSKLEEVIITITYNHFNNYLLTQRGGGGVPIGQRNQHI